ncbi:hypothetical protein SZN_08971 [Streptomyces zinciresistens K42]|uniref:Uncharacterized protein n=1 Tax=Streptomyces zinciresistens K42 TaxID=700597 RepID=G2G8I0_9ACTN|nr:hypothetical protein SZN_08971 [Streptomyces zinciresistens K42]
MERELTLPRAHAGVGASPSAVGSAAGRDVPGGLSIASRSRRWQIGQWRVRCRYEEAADRWARSRARVSCLVDAAIRHLQGAARERGPCLLGTQ